MERGFGGEGVPDFPGAEVGGYFRVPLGVSRGVSRTSFLEEFREFPHFGGGSKSMAGAMF